MFDIVQVQYDIVLRWTTLFVILWMRQYCCIVLPVNDIVKVAVLHGRNDLLEQPLRLLGGWPSLRHDVVEQLSVRRILLIR